MSTEHDASQNEEQKPPEPMEKQKAETTEPTPTSPASEPSKISKTKPVIMYIVIMFAVALFLIILSFFMQQRNHEAVLKGLSNTALNAQTIVDLELENKNLKDSLAENKNKLDIIQAEKEQLTESNADLTQQLVAVEWLMELQKLNQSGHYSNAKELVQQMEEKGLVDALPKDSALPDETPAPRAQFDQIKAQLSK